MIGVVKRSCHLDETTDKALRKYMEKTQARPSEVLREAVKDFVINRAHETIPKLSARVQLRETLRDYKEAGKLMKLLKSSGFGNFNLQQTFDDIERMPIKEKEKEQLRETAKFYDGFKRNGSKKVVKLIQVAYPSAIEAEETREDKFLKAMHRYVCKGCMYIGKDDFCKQSCKKFKRMSPSEVT